MWVGPRVSYEVVGLIGKGAAEVMASNLVAWCANMDGGDLPMTWAKSILSLIPKAGRGGRIRNLRPIGMAFVLQNAAAACIISKSMSLPRQSTLSMLQDTGRTAVWALRRCQSDFLTNSWLG